MGPCTCGKLRPVSKLGATFRRALTLLGPKGIRDLVSTSPGAASTRLAPAQRMRLRRGSRGDLRRPNAGRLGLSASPHSRTPGLGCDPARRPTATPAGRCTGGSAQSRRSRSCRGTARRRWCRLEAGGGTAHLALLACVQCRATLSDATRIPSTAPTAALANRPRASSPAREPAM